MAEPTPTTKPNSADVFWKVIDEYRAPGALGYLIVTVAGMLLYFLIMSSIGGDIMAIIAAIVAFAGITLKWGGAPIIVILLTLVGLLDPGFFIILNFIETGRWVSLPMDTGFSLMNLLLAIAIVTYCLGHYRLISVTHRVLPDDPNPLSERPGPKATKRPAAIVPGNEVIYGVVAVVSLTIIGQIAWSLLCYSSALGPAKLLVSGLQRLALFALIAIVVVMITSVISLYLRTWNMTRREGELMARDISFHESRRETDRIQRWRQWFKVKAAKRRLNRKG